MLYKLINKGGYDKEDMLTKLDTFYANGRITQAQYMELLEMVLSEEAPVAQQAKWFSNMDSYEGVIRINSEGVSIKSNPSVGCTTATFL